MIAKDCGTGKSFIGLGAYLATGKGGEDPERVLWSRGINLPSDDIQAGAAMMRSHANENTRVEKPVYHFSIAWHPSEFDGRDQARALAIVSETLNDLGLSNHQALAIAHWDTEHFHVHVMVNRIDPETGKSWKQGLSKIALENIMADLSLEHGFEVVPGRHNARDLGLEPVEPDLSAPSEAQRFEERTGADSALTRAREELAEPIRGATSWKDLEERLASLGYEVQARGRGLVFTGPEGVPIKASAVDRDFSRAALAERFEEDLAEYRGTAADEKTPAAMAKAALTFNARAAKDASPLLKAARSWSELDKGLYQAGYVIQAKGRGLVLTDGSEEIKLSSISRQFSKHALEGRFAESFQQYTATTKRPRITPAAAKDRARVLDTAVRQLERFEQRTDQLTTMLCEREQVLRATQEPFDRMAKIKQLRDNADRAFSQHYRAPDKAKEKFGRYAEKHGADQAAAELRTNPGRFGRPNGIQILNNVDPRRAEALKDLSAAGEGLQEARRLGKQLRDQSADVDKFKAMRGAWQEHAGIAKLADQVGKTPKENLSRRIVLERAVLTAAEGMTPDELDTIPGRSKLRRRVIASTVDQLREDRSVRREGRDPNEPRPPLTATPKEQAVYEAARDYAKARAAFRKYAYNLERRNHRNDEPFKRLDAAANKILEKHPEALNQMSRFGLSRRDVIKDSSLSSTASRTQNLARRLRRIRARMQGMGQGVSMGLELFRRR